MERDFLKSLLAEGLSLKEIGQRVGRHPSTVSYWLARHGLVPVGRQRHAARGGLARHDLQRLVEGGLSIRAIGEALDVSPATVRHWLAKYELETARSRAAQGRGPRAAHFDGVCPKHGSVRFGPNGRPGDLRCVKCRSEAVASRRRRVRQALIQEAGGRCAICGYDRYVGALEFHHLDPSQKKFGLSSRGVTRSIKRLREEAKKCVLLCGNCHAEVEGGVRSVSLQFPGPRKS